MRSRPRMLACALSLVACSARVTRPEIDAWELGWAGIVAVWASGIETLTAASVDGADLLLARSPTSVAYLDTTRLSNGPHHIRIEGDGQGFSRTVESDVTIANAPASALAAPFSAWPILPATPGEGIQNEETASGAIAADLDDDGDLDLFAWTRTEGRILIADRGAWHEAALKVDGVSAAAAGDLDGDGHTDLVAAGRRIHLLHNLGDGTFAAWPAPGEDPQVSQHVHGVGLADIDEDGRLEVILGRMSCGATQPTSILRNEGSGRFVDVAPTLGLDYPGQATFALAIDDVVEGAGGHVWPLTEGCQPPPPSAYLRLAPGEDLPEPMDVTKAGAPSFLGVMGTSYLDADGDGQLDLFAARSTEQLLLRGPDFVEDLSKPYGLNAMPDPLGLDHNQWDVARLDADLDGWDELVVAQSVIPYHFGEPGLSPRLQLFRRTRIGPFREIAASAGLGETRHCLGLQAADLDGDGDADLIAACGDGVETFRNETPAGPGRTLLLKGTLSNGSGYGARIEAPGTESRLWRGTGQPFMLGEAAPNLRAPEGTAITVRWPSGLVQQVRSGRAPLMKIEEPRVLVLSRTEVNAGGADVIVELFPHRTGAATGEIILSGASWRIPMTRRADGSLRGAIATPPRPGNVRLTITIDGRALRVRPRIIVL